MLFNWRSLSRSIFDCFLPFNFLMFWINVVVFEQAKVRHEFNLRFNKFCVRDFGYFTIYVISCTGYMHWTLQFFHFLSLLRWDKLIFLCWVLSARLSTVRQWIRENRRIWGYRGSIWFLDCRQFSICLWASLSAIAYLETRSLLRTELPLSFGALGCQGLSQALI